MLHRKKFMLERFIPWKFLVRHISRSYGLIDPFIFLAKLRRFSQSSDIQEPFELLRAGIIFHARGLINTRAIQNNLDWVWPLWVEKQFNPQDPSFIPRAYSLTHVNLTNRNWTAVGQPYLPLYPLVDPRGLVTPLYDGWSIDFWMIGENGPALIPSKLQKVDQRFIDPDLTVQTHFSENGFSLTTIVHMEIRDEIPVLTIRARGLSDRPNSSVAASLRPYNPEGIQFIERIRFDRNSNSWRVNSKTGIHISKTPAKVLFSNYRAGDVIHQLAGTSSADHIDCHVGMATSAAVFPLEKDVENEIEFSIPLKNELAIELENPPRKRETWDSVLTGTAKLSIPDKKLSFLYDTAVKTLILLSADEIFPGPYTYRRFWFRDACLMIHALLCAGLGHWCIRLLDQFFIRQKHSGYFQSQEGEWDSNGQVLWIFYRFHQLASKAGFKYDWLNPLFKGAAWITKKRIPKGRKPHSGLLPAGFSAEHFGPNDYYYWDDFWGMAGLKSAARLAEQFGYPNLGKDLLNQAADFEETIFTNIATVSKARTPGSIPASPYRRMDSAAIGSLVADYPLDITEPGHPLIAGTAEYLITNCVQSGSFFQDMIHSGMNPYLTLCLAQSLLRLGDNRFRSLLMKTAGLASSTGQWPEAVHPFTGGGCMGDGQHGWAAAEWVMMIRNLFVREEKDKLILGSGIFPEWIESGEPLDFGPAPVPFGMIHIRIFRENGTLFLEMPGTFHRPAPEIEIRVPGYHSKRIDRMDGRHELIPLES